MAVAYSWQFHSRYAASRRSRDGKAVEINALWYNALCVTAAWLDTVGDKDRARELSSTAARIRESFNPRFWAPQLGYCYDVVDKEGGG